MSDVFLGIDVGTQGAKALLLDREEGHVVARSARSYGLIEGLAPSAKEQHPSTWLDALREILMELAERSREDGLCWRGIAVSGQQHGFVPLDREGCVLRPAKLWCDTETNEEAEELSRTLGHPVPTGFTASKILWMRRHEPELFARLEHVLLPHDWINFCLSGTLAMEHGDASGSGFFDPVNRTWDPRAAAAIAPDLLDKLPPLLRAGSVLGRLRPELAEELGLPSDVLIATGGGDNMMSAIGAGAVAPGRMVLSLGSSATLFSYAPQPVVDPSGSIAAFCDSTGGYLPLLCVMNCTLVTEELRQTFRSGEEPDSHEAWEERAARVPRGADGLLFVPFLQGERVPDLPKASGSLLGLRSGNMQAEAIYRAAMEGVACNLASGLRQLEQAIEGAAGPGACAGSPSAIRVVGGGAKSRLWLQILADCFDRDLLPMEETESAALGAAIHAWWTWERSKGSGRTLSELCDVVLGDEGTDSRRIRPCPEGVQAYAELRKSFEEALRRLHDQVRAKPGGGF